MSKQKDLSASIIEQNIAELHEVQISPYSAMILSGGGAKGAVYPGAYAAMVDAGIMNNISIIAGSSAGAITAAFIATGIDAKKFAELSRATKLTDLLGSGAITKDGQPLLDFLRKTIKDNFNNYFEENEDIGAVLKQRLAAIEETDKTLNEQLKNYQAQLSGYREKARQSEVTKNLILGIEQKIHANGADKAKIENLKINNSENFDLEKFAELRERCQAANAKITFKDLALLRLCDPDKFKQLAVTAVPKTAVDNNPQPKFFDAQHSPDVEIALACRASASIPIFFKPVEIDGVEYVDGGYKNNIPISYLDQPTANQSPKKTAAPTTNFSEIQDISDDFEEIKIAKSKAKPIVFAFGNDMNASANIAIYTAKETIFDPGTITRFVLNVVLKVLAGVRDNFKYTDAENATLERVRAEGVNVVVLNTGSVGTLSFGTAEQKAEYLYIKGYCQTQLSLENFREDEYLDPRRGLRSFMLDVYEHAVAKRENTWIGKVKTIEEGVKNKELLSFCKTDENEVNSKWQNTAKNDYQLAIKKFVATACAQTPPKEPSKNSKTIDILLARLNKKDKPDVKPNKTKSGFKPSKDEASSKLIEDAKREFRLAIRGSSISMENTMFIAQNIDTSNDITKDDIKKFLEIKENKDLVPKLSTGKAAGQTR